MCLFGWQNTNVAKHPQRAVEVLGHWFTKSIFLLLEKPGNANGS